MLKKFIFLLFLFTAAGCAVTGTEQDIKFHTGNIKVSLGSQNTTINWESLPDHKGEFLVRNDTSCDKINFFSPPGHSSIFTLTKAPYVGNLIPITRDTTELVAEPRKRDLPKYTSQLGDCDLLIVEKWICKGNCYRTEPMSIIAIDKNSLVVDSFKLSERKKIPLEFYPDMALAGTVDVASIGLILYIIEPVLPIIGGLALIGFAGDYLSKEKEGKYKRGR
jgi:hypothetical protein